ncbi:MAG: fructosamine kinase family protein [Phycisphaeraceae bacterium]|nr:fructosamine kinase family protein [Phycisphaerales bacterium]MCB9859357.1 fructosamine kinase family protein [Phycisphaeraceae bacterium]
MRDPVVSNLAGLVSDVLGVRAHSIRRLTGGCVGDVFSLAVDPIVDVIERNVSLATSLASADHQIVVKYDANAGAIGSTSFGSLETEAFMLRYLGDYTQLPVPKVLHSSAMLLVMTKLPGSTCAGAQAQQHLGELVAHLHSITSDRCGFERDTLIGPLVQPNPDTDAWIPFFAEHRLSYMACLATNANQMPSSIAHRVDRLCNKLDNLLNEPEKPSLLHGDLWSGNVLADESHVTGIIDPAISYGHHECDLAYMTLFGCFGESFFAAYRDNMPIEPGFERDRRPIYQLWPLLVHVRLFGGSYVSSVDQSLRRFGV